MILHFSREQILALKLLEWNFVFENIAFPRLADCQTSEQGSDFGTPSESIGTECSDDPEESDHSSVIVSKLLAISLSCETVIQTRNSIIGKLTSFVEVFAFIDSLPHFVSKVYGFSCAGLNGSSASTPTKVSNVCFEKIGSMPEECTETLNSMGIQFTNGELKFSIGETVALFSDTQPSLLGGYLAYMCV